MTDDMSLFETLYYEIVSALKDNAKKTKTVFLFFFHSMKLCCVEVDYLGIRLTFFSNFYVPFATFE